MTSGFGPALREARVQKGLGMSGLCRRVGLSRKRLAAIEEGWEIPSGPEMARIVGSFPALVAWKPVVRACELPAANLRSSQSFEEALERLRRAALLTQEDLGALLGVSGQAVSFWELGVSTPITDHYRQLRDLFPELSDAPEPDHKSWSRPGPLPETGGAPPRPPSLPPVSPAPQEPFLMPLLTTAFPILVPSPLRSALRTMAWLGTLRQSDLGPDFLALLRDADAEGLTLKEVLSLVEAR